MLALTWALWFWRLKVLRKGFSTVKIAFTDFDFLVHLVFLKISYYETFWCSERLIIQQMLTYSSSNLKKTTGYYQNRLRPLSLLPNLSFSPPTSLHCSDFLAYYSSNFLVPLLICLSKQYTKLFCMFQNVTFLKQTQVYPLST